MALIQISEILEIYQDICRYMIEMPFNICVIVCKVLKRYFPFRRLFFVQTCTN